MKVLFSIEFNFRDRVYCGIVRVNEDIGATEYNVRIMNSRLDHWLYGYHEFRTEHGQLTYIPSKAPERTEKLRQAVYDGLCNWLQNHEVAPPPQKAGKTSSSPYYIHPIRSVVTKL